MQIKSGSVVSIDYTLTDANKQVLDSSEGGQPLVYLHGVGQLIRGLEATLEGKEKGAKLNVTIPAADAYGEHDDQKIQTVSRAQLKSIHDLEEGMQLQASGPQGNMIVTVAKIEGDKVTLDGNHPLAGKDLTFDVTVQDVRDATAEEKSHGHVHGPGGHHH